MLVSIQIGNLVLRATILEKLTDYFLIELSWNDAAQTFAEVLHRAGVIPLPPYLNRMADEQDKTNYQTIYAKHDGSVAAPTAGLHFTDNLLTKLNKQNIAQAYVTLHVGAGTFKPVKAEKMEDHEMHSEFIDVSIETIQQLINYVDKTIVAVGTTSLRTIESLYWMGVKAKSKLAVDGWQLVGEDEKTNDVSSLTIAQWDAYELPQNITAKDALENLLQWMYAHNLQRLITKTQIIIAPSYQLKVAEGLITNFHQPQSTLLLLVAAIVGNDWKKIYNYALQNNFRFLSYGDGSLLWKKN